MEERKRETGGEEKEEKKRRKRLGQGKVRALPLSGTGRAEAGLKQTELQKNQNGIKRRNAPSSDDSSCFNVTRLKGVFKK